MDAYSYFVLRDHLADDIRAGVVRAEPLAMVNRVASCAGISRGDAAEAVERFLSDLQRELARPPSLAKADRLRLSRPELEQHAIQALHWNEGRGTDAALWPANIVDDYCRVHGLEWTDGDRNAAAGHVQRALTNGGGGAPDGVTNDPATATPAAARAWNAPPDPVRRPPVVTLPKRPAPR